LRLQASAMPARPPRGALHAAVRCREHAELLRLVAAGADVNRADIDFYTALHLACDIGDVVSAALLLEAGADPNASHPGLDGWTPLHLAAWRGHCECVQALLAKGADAHALDWYGRTPSDWAPAAAAGILAGAAQAVDRFSQLRGKGNGQPSALHLANIESCLEASNKHGAAQGSVIDKFDKHAADSKL